MNGQKKVAIEEGRKQVGLKGNGKGSPLAKVEMEVDNTMSVDATSSPSASDQEKGSAARATRRPSKRNPKRRATKRAYKEGDGDDDNNYGEETPAPVTPPKKRTRQNVSQPQLPLLNTAVTPQSMSSSNDNTTTPPTSSIYHETPDTTPNRIHGMPFTNGRGYLNHGMQFQSPTYTPPHQNHTMLAHHPLFGSGYHDHHFFGQPNFGSQFQEAIGYDDGSASFPGNGIFNGDQDYGINDGEWKTM